MVLLLCVVSEVDNSFRKFASELCCTAYGYRCGLVVMNHTVWINDAMLNVKKFRFPLFPYRI